MQLFKVEVRLDNLASSQALHWNNHIQITDQIEHNMTKNPNWREANQLAIYKRGRNSNSGPPGCESSALTTRPHCLLLNLSCAGLYTRRTMRHNQTNLTLCTQVRPRRNNASVV